ncbi:hypothetical protein TUN199_11602 [Pyrenophora tritici-repentis]|nr:hypothetical protein TUN199_11602 [Pyrenophora tritici-repentis]
MALKNTNHPKGGVREGSSLTMVGHCRPIYVADVPDSDYDYNFNEVAWAIGGSNKPGSHFPGVDKDYERDNVKKYLCVQIVRERKERGQRPKIIGLVLKKAENSTEEAFRRVGLTDFDEPVDGEWVRRTLKLL